MSLTTHEIYNNTTFSNCQVIFYISSKLHTKHFSILLIPYHLQIHSKTAPLEILRISRYRLSPNGSASRHLRHEIPVFRSVPGLLPRAFLLFQIPTRLSGPKLCGSSSSRVYTASSALPFPGTRRVRIIFADEGSQNSRITCLQMPQGGQKSLPPSAGPPDIATARIFRSPHETARETADLSAQMPAGYEAFSIFAPV